MSLNMFWDTCTCFYKLHKHAHKECCVNYAVFSMYNIWYLCAVQMYQWEHPSSYVRVLRLQQCHPRAAETEARHQCQGLQGGHSSTPVQKCWYTGGRVHNYLKYWTTRGPQLYTGPKMQIYWRYTLCDLLNHFITFKTSHIRISH